LDFAVFVRDLCFPGLDFAVFVRDGFRETEGTSLSDGDWDGFRETEGATLDDGDWEGASLLMIFADLVFNLGVFPVFVLFRVTYTSTLGDWEGASLLMIFAILVDSDDWIGFIERGEISSRISSQLSHSRFPSKIPAKGMDAPTSCNSRFRDDRSFVLALVGLARIIIPDAVRHKTRALFMITSIDGWENFC